MKIEKNKFALAAAGTLGVIYIICAIVVALAPALAVKLFGWLIHLVNADQFAIGVTAGGAIIGLIQVLVYTYLTAFVFAWLHNRFAGSTQAYRGSPDRAKEWS